MALELTDRQSPNSTRIVAGLGLGLEVPLSPRRFRRLDVDDAERRRRLGGDGQVVLVRGGGEEGQGADGGVEARAGELGHARRRRGLGGGRAVLLGHHAAESVIIVVGIAHAAHAVVITGGGGGAAGGVQKRMKVGGVAIARVGRVVGKDLRLPGLEADGDAAPVIRNGQGPDPIVEGPDGPGLGGGGGAISRSRWEDVQDAVLAAEEGHLLLLLLLLAGTRGGGERAQGVGSRLVRSREAVVLGGGRRHGSRHDMCWVFFECWKIENRPAAKRQPACNPCEFCSRNLIWRNRHTARRNERGSGRDQGIGGGCNSEYSHPSGGVAPISKTT